MDYAEMVRLDMDSNYAYTKLQMISDLIKELKGKNPDISQKELWKQVEAFRKKNNWSL